jgi:uncharacterized protein YcfJ
MEKISTATRIHPLMAAAALSVITVSIAGTAAITGLLPSSQARVATHAAAAVTPEQQLLQAQQLLAAQQLAAQHLAPQPLAQPQLPPQFTPIAAMPAVAAAPVKQLVAHTHEVERPVVKRKVQARERVRTERVVYREPARRAPRYDSTPDYRAAAPAPAPRQPNYVGIGTGAVIGGLIGNQIGGGNGKKLATLAGVIGGGYLGNEIANRNQR